MITIMRVVVYVHNGNLKSFVRRAFILYSWKISLQFFIQLQLPLAEVITDFFDQLKSRTKGYASMSFTDIGYRADKLVRMDIRINGEEAPPLTTIVHRDVAHEKGKIVCNKLKELIPRQQFKVTLLITTLKFSRQLSYSFSFLYIACSQIPIQACVGVKPIASAHISPVMKRRVGEMLWR